MIVNGNPLSTRQLSEIDMIEVTAENIGNYTIEDVVFPIVGHKVRMPAHPEINAIVADIMAEDGMSMQQFNNHASLVSTCAAGSYRKIIGRADDIVFDIVQVQDHSKDLLTPNYLTEGDPKPEVDLEKGGSVSKALRIKFSLKSSCYATMFLREVMRSCSDHDTQVKITPGNAN